MTEKTRIVVVGGGAGGLELVRKLGRVSRRAAFDVTLVEPQQTHVWKPLLHEVAAGALDANLDEVGYREHAHRSRYRFVQGRLEDIDRPAREIVLSPLLDEDGSEILHRRRLRYDYLVLAVGSVTNPYNTPGADEHSIFLDDVGDADRFRMKLLGQCLRVSQQVSEAPASDARVRIAIVGAAMDWQEFEHLVREVFEGEFAANGGEVKITQASRDGGVDAIAFDPDPIRGGKIVIQAKRYTNVVELSAVRDLYGTVQNERAMKGILVTTSTFGPDAYRFAQDKPLTLVDGSGLLYLLQKRGVNARIDIAEAKRIRV